MIRAILLTCVLATSSALKIQQNAEAEGCPITCMCSKSQFAFLFSKAGPQKMKARAIEEAKALLAASQKEMDEVGKPAAPKPVVGAGIFGAFIAPPKKTAEQLQMEIDRRQKKVQQLEEELASSQLESGEDMAGDLCCTNHANAERDCAGEDKAGVAEFNKAEDERTAAEAQAAEDAKAAEEEMQHTLKTSGYFPNRITYDKTEEERAAIEAEEGEKSRAKLETMRIQDERLQALTEERNKRAQEQREWQAANKEALAAEAAQKALDRQAAKEAAKKRAWDKLSHEESYSIR